MAKCNSCGNTFSVQEARNEYHQAVGGDGDYDADHGTDRCFDCAMSEDESNRNSGRAILMMNGDEDYDPDHVEEYL